MFKNIFTDSKLKDLGKYSCFAFGISTHGIEIKTRETKKENKKFFSHHAVQMFDGDYFYTKDIIEYFRDRNCRALRNKPKMFFIQVTQQIIERLPVHIFTQYNIPASLPAGDFTQ